MCVLLLAACWVLTKLAALLHTLLMARLSFCADNTIHYFFCDVVPLLQLSCSDTSINQVTLFAVGSMILTGSLCLIILSHTRIISSILRVPSAPGRQKALSTCGSHLTVVFLFYGMTIWVYLCPPSSHSGDEYRHCSDTDSEPLHLQPQEQGYEGGIEQAFGNSHTIFSGTLILNPYFAVSLCRTHVFVKEYNPLLY